MSMNDVSSQHRRLQVVRLTLLMAAFGWGLSLIFLLSPWNVVVEKLSLMGAKPLQYDSFLDHWMRQTAVTFVALGGLCLIAAIRPQKYASVIRPIAWFHGALGITAATSAWVNGLTMQTHPTLPAELTFSLVICGVILFYAPGNRSRFTKKTDDSSNPEEHSLSARHRSLPDKI